MEERNKKISSQNQLFRIKSKTRGFGALLLLFLAFIAFPFSKEFVKLEEMGNEQKNGNLSVSGYWELTEPIVIDDFESNNWAWTAANKPWCSGEGTPEKPYRIENVTINGNNLTSCIQISNSNANFVIENCTLFNSSGFSYTFSQAAIKLESVMNGQIVSNNCSRNNGAGIILLYCDNNIVSGNTINYNKDSGIGISGDSFSGDFSKTNTISENKMKGNLKYGISLSYCINHNISGNNICDNHLSGIYMTGDWFLGASSKNNLISGNNISSNGEEGIKFNFLCSRNTLLENTIDNNNLTGINLGYFCLDNTILGNSLSDNHLCGMEIGPDCSNNTISQNIATHNQDYGISLFDGCFKNNITGNIASNNEKDGIFLNLDCYNNSISGNIASNNGKYGISIGRNCYNNTILRNHINENNNSGLYLYMPLGLGIGAIDNTVLGNVASNNSDYGILIDDNCADNLMYQNFFIENGLKNALDNGSGNQWDNGYMGNYWDDYNGIDENGDGIGETPYNVSEDPLIQDRYPIIWRDNNPIANFTVNSTTVFEGECIQFNFTGELGNQPTGFEWEFGDETTSEEKDPVHKYEKNGTYIVKLTVTDWDYDSNSTAMEIEIKYRDLSPKANFTINATSVYEGDFILFNFTGELGNQPTGFEWEFGDETTSEEKDPVYKYKKNGTYVVKLTVTDWDGDQNFTTKEIEIKYKDLKPKANFTANTTSINEGESVQFNFTGALGNQPAIFEWDFGDGVSSIEQDPVHQYTISRTFTVNLTVRDRDGDVNSSTMEIEVKFIDLKPKASFIVNATTIIEGDVVQFDFLGELGNLPARLEWDFGDGSPVNTELNPIHQYTINDIYTVNLTVIDRTNECSSYQLDIIVLEDIVPVALFIANTTRVYIGEYVQFAFIGNLGNDPNSFQWDFGDDSPVSTDQNPVHQFSTEGEYNITLIISDRDGDISSMKVTIFVNKSPSGNGEPFSPLPIIFTITGASAATIAIFTIALIKKKKVNQKISSNPSGHKNINNSHKKKDRL
ncbi:MAG: PKD domain-containing protein [Candidatus Lokiarchaeota archaeon]|nr:PKD domain-containing protein [Candidatus Lokiarchaeota archaeon]